MPLLCVILLFFTFSSCVAPLGGSTLAYYTVTTVRTANGNLLVSQSASGPFAAALSAAQGSTVYIRAEPDTGYDVAEYGGVNPSGGQFAMPGNDVTLTVKFRPQNGLVQYKTIPPANAAYTINGSQLNYTDSGHFTGTIEVWPDETLAGGKVTLTIKPKSPNRLKPSSLKVFSAVSAQPLALAHNSNKYPDDPREEYSFIMPQGDITDIQALFQQPFGIKLAAGEVSVITGEDGRSITKNNEITQGFAFQGDTITVLVKPPAGFLDAGVTVKPDGGQDINLASPPYTFIMPGGDVKIEANPFTRAPAGHYTVAVLPSAFGGYVTANPASGPANELITLTAFPMNGYLLDSIKAYDTASIPLTQTAPDKRQFYIRNNHVTVEAVFKPVFETNFEFTQPARDNLQITITPSGSAFIYEITVGYTAEAWYLDGWDITEGAQNQSATINSFKAEAEDLYRMTGRVLSEGDHTLAVVAKGSDNKIYAAAVSVHLPAPPN